MTENDTFRGFDEENTANDVSISAENALNELENFNLSDDGYTGRNSLELYFKNISRYSPLTLEEERELGGRIRRGDQEALKKLVLANLRFVVSVANKYRNGGVPLTDLINEGNVGLLEAAKRYDPDKGVKFITYAVWWIRQAILQGLTEQSGAVRLPLKQANALYRINAAREKMTKEMKRVPTEEELAAATGIRKEDVEDIIRASRNNLSLDAPLNDEETGSFLDNLETSAPGAEDAIINKTLRDSVDEIVSDLEEREAKIIMKRFGLDGGDVKTLEEIGEEMNISRERVRQIEAKAMSKLKKKALRKKLHDFLN